MVNFSWFMYQEILHKMCTNCNFLLYFSLLEKLNSLCYGKNLVQGFHIRNDGCLSLCRFDMLHAQLGTLLENAQYLLADSAPAVSLTTATGGAGGQYGYSRAVDGHLHVRAWLDYKQSGLPDGKI